MNTLGFYARTYLDALTAAFTPFNAQNNNAHRAPRLVAANTSSKSDATELARAA